MKPFYASALLFLMVCGFWVASDTPYTTRHTHPVSQYDIGFGSFGTLHH